jgi:hypothetical protein
VVNNGGLSITGAKGHLTTEVTLPVDRAIMAFLSCVSLSFASIFYCVDFMSAFLLSGNGGMTILAARGAPDQN